MMRVAGRTYEVDWGHVLVATLVAGACVWYLADARATSTNVQNLLLVQPATILALILYVLILPQCVRRVADTPDQAALPGAARWTDLGRVAALAAAFGFFTFSLDRLGFDAGTWIFVTVGLFICGERRAWVLAVFPPVFTAAVVVGYQQLLPYPIRTLIL
jgi:hypothetical protein